MVARERRGVGCWGFEAGVGVGWGVGTGTTHGLFTPAEACLWLWVAVCCVALRRLFVLAQRAAGRVFVLVVSNVGFLFSDVPAAPLPSHRSRSPFVSLARAQKKTPPPCLILLAGLCTPALIDSG